MKLQVAFVTLLFSITATILLVVKFSSVVKVSRKSPSKNKTLINYMENRGCLTKKLEDYVASDKGGTYVHSHLVHYAKFSSNFSKENVTLNFREHTSVLSIYKFLKPKRLIFHTFTGFSGHYWEKILRLKDIQLDVGEKKVIFVEHQADYVKLSMLYKYGGTALDFDVIMLNGTKWRHLQNISECVLVEEAHIVNGGLYSCIQNSRYVAKWLEGYHTDYRPKEWVYNASRKPLWLLQGKECYNVHVDRTVCLNPQWSDCKRWIQMNGAKWRNKTAVHYYIKKGIPNDGEGLLKEKFPLAKLIQHVHNL